MNQKESYLRQLPIEAAAGLGDPIAKKIIEEGLNGRINGDDKNIVQTCLNPFRELRGEGVLLPNNWGFDLTVFQIKIQNPKDEKSPYFLNLFFPSFPENIPLNPNIFKETTERVIKIVNNLNILLNQDNPNQNDPNVVLPYIFIGQISKESSWEEALVDALVLEIFGPKLCKPEPITSIPLTTLSKGETSFIFYSTPYSFLPDKGLYWIVEVSKEKVNFFLIVLDSCQQRKLFLDE